MENRGTRISYHCKVFCCFFATPKYRVHTQLISSASASHQQMDPVRGVNERHAATQAANNRLHYYSRKVKQNEAICLIEKWNEGFILSRTGYKWTKVPQPSWYHWHIVNTQDTCCFYTWTCISAVHDMPLYGVCIWSKPSQWEHMILQIVWVIQLFCHLDRVPPLKRKFISLSTHKGAGTYTRTLIMAAIFHK